MSLEGIIALSTQSANNFTTTPVNILTGERFFLIPFLEKDISPRYIGWLNDPSINAFMASRFVRQTDESVLEYVRSFNGSSGNLMWGIYPKGSNQLIGTATLKVVSQVSGVFGIGQLIGETQYWGKGAAEETIRLVLEFGFGNLGFHKAMGTTNAMNHGVNFTLKRLGFTLEAKRRALCILDTGGYADEFIWGLLADEWKGKSDTPANS